MSGPILAGQSSIIWVVHVDLSGDHDVARRCKYVNLVSVSNTHVAGEAEFLFAPYSIFTVRSVAWDAAGGLHRVELDAATDNKVATITAGGERWAVGGAAGTRGPAAGSLVLSR